MAARPLRQPPAAQAGVNMLGTHPPIRAGCSSSDRTRECRAVAWRALSTTVNTGIPFSARHFEYSTEYLTYIPCQQTAKKNPKKPLLG
eukprot:9471326-Pyramimonas_sp.AAC.1